MNLVLKKKLLNNEPIVKSSHYDDFLKSDYKSQIQKLICEEHDNLQAQFLVLLSDSNSYISKNAMQFD
jgi:hypothetical protein